MELIVNGRTRLSEATTLHDVWRVETEYLELPGPRGYAIALNGQVVRQTDWAATRVRSGDKVEIIRAMPGG